MTQMHLNVLLKPLLLPYCPTQVYILSVLVCVRTHVLCVQCSGDSGLKF